MGDERSAIEALRAGVPNRAAIRVLGTTEDKIEQKFIENLHACKRNLLRNAQAVGQVVAGGFGAGKSHLLGYLQEIALAENFIVSSVVISKETPLFDLGKVYVAAMRNAAVPNRNDEAMTAVLSKLRFQSDEYNDFQLWADSKEAQLSPLFAALLHLLPQPQTDPERMQQIARFLAGSKLGVSSVRQWLREIGASGLFPMKPIKQPEVMRQRLRFVPRLIAAAGYSGWVVLFDEVELIGRYSVLQRGRSYSELARWLGLDADEKISGAVTVAAITDDFTSEIIGKRRDDEHVPPRLAIRDERKVIERARLGMGALEKSQILLRAPETSFLNSSLAKTRDLYAKAYGWDAKAKDIGEITAAKSIRQYVKSWITAWDIERLYGATDEIVTESMPADYRENEEIEGSEAAPDGDSDED